MGCTVYTLPAGYPETVAELSQVRDRSDPTGASPVSGEPSAASRRPPGAGAVITTTARPSSSASPPNSCEAPQGPAALAVDRRLHPVSCEAPEMTTYTDAPLPPSPRLVRGIALPPPSRADPAGGPAHRISRSAYNGARQLISRMSPPMIWVGCREKVAPACF